ncbi:hypothetical protein OKW76_02495 [Sphingomonas sp. S1-29]|uniref:hypothetical protein n=1 Tax=Sphingomonas sp. S1-29 TaxID=2991074 RepID=UPI0022404B92|nr:hypothetical protein [Sphingomonas sp. S1-29]UZK69945.1 hypothetical protein OKW76_02495 [Sphingomonas sp. S1-29]
MLALAACSEAEPPIANEPVIANIDEQVRVARAADSRILCAPRGAEGFAPNCTIERIVDDKGTLLTLRLPDGGFHRLRVASDGSGVVAADGAEPASVAIVADGLIEVAIGDSKFRLPAIVEEGAPT